MEDVETRQEPNQKYRENRALRLWSLLRSEVTAATKSGLNGKGAIQEHLFLSSGKPKREYRLSIVTVENGWNSRLPLAVFDRSSRPWQNVCRPVSLKWLVDEEYIFVAHGQDINDDFLAQNQARLYICHDQNLDCEVLLIDFPLAHFAKLYKQWGHVQTKRARSEFIMAWHTAPAKARPGTRKLPANLPLKSPPPPADNGASLPPSSSPPAPISPPPTDR